MRWQIIYRAKKTPYVIGLEKRTKTKIVSKPNTVYLSGNDLTDRKTALRRFKDIYYWAIVTSLKRI